LYSLGKLLLYFIGGRSFLDRNDDIGLVFPNFYYVNELGEILGVESRKKIGQEVELLNLPAHGAGTMIRKRHLKLLGGYNPSYDRQDGWELWLRFIRHFKVSNLTVPLFFYRRHGKNLTEDNTKLLEVRRKIEHDAAQKFDGEISPRVMGIVLANEYPNVPSPMSFLGQQRVIDVVLSNAHQVNRFDRLALLSNSNSIREYTSLKYPNVILLESKDSHDEYGFDAQLASGIDYVEATHSYYPDVIVCLNGYSPLCSADYILSAIDTLFIYPVDSVISVYESDKLYKTARFQPITLRDHRQRRWLARLLAALRTGDAR
jgi:hypothetical protein